MAGESNLLMLLRDMEPHLFAEPYGYVVLPTGEAMPTGLVPLATIAEQEGLTIVAAADNLARAGKAAEPLWARISLTIHSDLSAVGLTAAFAAVLADRGISANVIAGFYHDHIFVPWERREDALAALIALAKGGSDV